MNYYFFLAVLFLFCMNGQGESIKMKKNVGDTEEIYTKEYVDLNFEDFSVRVFRFKTFNKNINEVVFSKDSIIKVKSDLGFTPFCKVVQIKNSNWNETRVYWRYKTSLSISDEGPHLDLLDWKHYTSDWEEVDKIDGNNWWLIDYGIVRRERKFPDVSKEEIIQAIIDHSDNDSQWLDVWNKYYKNKHANDVLLSLFDFSHMYLKITGIDENGVKQERMIEIMIPLGC